MTRESCWRSSARLPAQVPRTEEMPVTNRILLSLFALLLTFSSATVRAVRPESRIR